MKAEGTACPLMQMRLLCVFMWLSCRLVCLGKFQIEHCTLHARDAEIDHEAHKPKVLETGLFVYV